MLDAIRDVGSLLTVEQDTAQASLLIPPIILYKQQPGCSLVPITYFADFPEPSTLTPSGDHHNRALYNNCLIPFHHIQQFYIRQTSEERSPNHP